MCVVNGLVGLLGQDACDVVFDPGEVNSERFGCLLVVLFDRGDYLGVDVGAHPGEVGQVSVSVGVGQCQDVVFDPGEIDSERFG